MIQKNTPFASSFIKPLFSIGLMFLLLTSSFAPAFAQSKVSGTSSAPAGKLSEREKKERARQLKLEKKQAEKDRKRYRDGERPGEKIIVQSGGQRTVNEIMAAQSLVEGQKTNREIIKEKGIKKVEREVDRSNLLQTPGAPNVSRFPYSGKDGAEEQNYSPFAPQTIGLNFDTVNGPTETGAFPPDTMGAVGPTQFFVALNGRFRTFSKATGLADGVVNVDSDVFFASVMSPTAINFSTDPNVRFDRLSGRWFLNMIDVPNGTGATVNRIMIAVSDGPNITGGTVWTYYQFLGSATLFTDYQSFGVDASALYIGANMFTTGGTFSRCDVWVIPKAPTLTAGAITVYSFANVTTGATAGPFAPRGVDNVDPTNTGPTAVGYFIGVDVGLFSLLQIRRVTNPGASGGPPTISANVPLTVPTTTSPNRVTHLGNTGGTNGGLDALDDRLYAAVLRNGRLWTAHNFRTSSAGVGTIATNSRNSIRWYEIQNVSGTPSLFQSGTVYDTQALLADARQYWIPSITVTGQGHAAIGASTAGTLFRADAFTTGRLVGDALGAMRNSPGSIAGYTTSTTAYNPPGDSGGASGRRWGDYSFTSLDPLDDMTIWTIQEYNNGTNTYNTRVAQLRAPGPASIADGPNAGGLYNLASGLIGVNLTISGTSVSGTGWYDPGPNLGGGAVNFNHITASVGGSNVVVNNVIYNSPTSITLNVTTTGASVSDPNLSPDSLRDLTITNPDGQFITRNGIINIVSPTAAGATITGKAVKPDGRPLIGATMSLTGTFGPETRTSVTRTDGSYFFQDVPAGNDVIISPERHGYTFSPTTRFVNLTEDIDEVDFTGTPGAIQSRAAINDFDGDGISDYAVYRPAQNVWYILESSTNTMRSERWGLETDVPVAADFDGDGKTDVAMWRPADGDWHIIQSSDGVEKSLHFGSTGDIPVYGYYDGDTKADFAVFRPSTAMWWILESTTGNTRAMKWGLPTDRPVPADYDGDGVSDFAVYRPEEGMWYVLKSADNSHLFYKFGLSEDVPAPGDFDGDGKADLSVYRPENGVWYRTDSSTSAFSSVLFGLGDDLVTTGDFDGDSRVDISLFRESDSKWHVKPSLLGGSLETKWGMNGDIPVRPPFMR